MSALESSAKRPDPLLSGRMRRPLLALTVLGVVVFMYTQYSLLNASQQVYEQQQQQRQAKPSGGQEPMAAEDNILNALAANQDENETPEPLTHTIDLPPPSTFKPVSPSEQEKRRLAVRAGMAFAWSNYEEHAFGADVLGPVLGDATQAQWGNISCTLVDALDTLWLMDLKDEFARARDFVATNLSFATFGMDGRPVSVFETTIREVGGLLSAFDLSGDTVFRDKALEIIEVLVNAYSPRLGVFHSLYDAVTMQGEFPMWNGGRAFLADVGTLQLELRRLSDITNNPKYSRMGDSFYRIIQRIGAFNGTGLFPAHYDPETGVFDDVDNLITLGGLGDSFYEYLIKVFVYSGKRKEDLYLRKLYDEAVDGIETHLTRYSAVDDLYYIQQILLPSNVEVPHMEHLACFVPGMLVVGVMNEQHDAKKNARHIGLAKKLMETCYQMYHQQPTGLSPESVRFPNMSGYDRPYRLRPEVVESLFYLYRFTKDPKYREYGWEMFQSIEKHARVAHGYATVQDVAELPAQVENQMESFFLAETLKYHYLLQAPDDVLSLDEFVFNTEAHPLRIVTPETGNLRTEELARRRRSNGSPRSVRNYAAEEELREAEMAEEERREAEAEEAALHGVAETTSQ